MNKSFKIVLLIYSLLGIYLTYYIFTLEPYSGDLTRIGVYRENEFGWLENQKGFHQPKVKRGGGGIQDYDQQFDIFVLGDSFSAVNKDMLHFNWQEYLIRSSSVSLISFHHDDLEIPTFIHSPEFRRNPPRLFIFQIAEHGLQDALLDMDGFDAMENIPGPAPPKFKRHAIEGIELNFQRNVSPSFSFNTAVHHIKMKFKNLFSENRKVYLHLLSKNCFSSRNADWLLAYFGDRRKIPIKKPEWQLISNRIEKLQRMVQANGITHFLLLVAPDKSTIYKDYIVGDHPYVSGIDQLMLPQIPILPLQETLIGEIRQGELDVYLPNDSHWGFKGHKAAAEDVMRYLEVQGKD